MPSQPSRLSPLSSTKPSTLTLHWERGACPFFPHLPKQLSAQQLQQLIWQVVSLLEKQGIQAGSVVAFCHQYRLTALLCYLAAIELGAVVLMLNPQIPSALRSQLLAEKGITQFVDDRIFEQFDPTLTKVNRTYSSISSNTIATLTLTSGSSGNPKAVAHAVQNHRASADGVASLLGFSAEHSYLLSLPLHHVSGQGIVWRWLQAEATLVVYEDKVDFLPLLATVSHASLVPTQLQRYLATLNTPNGVQQTFLLGGTHIPAELVQQARERNIRIFSGYGMTEMASTVCAVENELDNVGKPLMGREVRIVKGEIWVRGTPLALGYWQQGELSPLTNAEGWFATKDGGYWQNDKLVVTGRLDNMFISGGENIQPETVESVLYRSEKLNTVYIVPVADREFGERPVALVEFTEPFSQQAVNELQNFAKLHLERFCQPIAYLPFESEQWQAGGIKVVRTQLKRYVAEYYFSEKK